MRLALFVCLMFTSTAVHGGNFVHFWLSFFPKWIPYRSNVDVMMLLDSSGSVGPTNFGYGKNGIQDTNLIIHGRTGGINGQPTGTRSGYIQFASPSNTAIRIHLHVHNNPFTLNNAIGSQTYTGGSTAIGMALYLAKKEFSYYYIPRKQRRVLLVTDGKETARGRPKYWAWYLKRRGVRICVVAIGNNVDMPTLNAIASRYYVAGSLRPCVGRVNTWRQFRDGIKSARILLRKRKMVRL